MIHVLIVVEFRLYQHLGDLNQNVSSIERRLGNIELAQTSAKDEESRFLKKLDQPNPPWRTPLFSETEKKPDLFDAKMDRVLSRVGKVVREGEWWFLAVSYFSPYQHIYKISNRAQVLLGLLTFHGTMLVLEVIEIFRERLKQDLNELRKSYKEAGA